MSRSTNLAMALTLTACWHTTSAPPADPAAASPPVAAKSPAPSPPVVAKPARDPASDAPASATERALPATQRDARLPIAPPLEPEACRMTRLGTCWNGAKLKPRVTKLAPQSTPAPAETSEQP